jgi:hypothetical protein
MRSGAGPVHPIDPALVDLEMTQTATRCVMRVKMKHFCNIFVFHRLCEIQMRIRHSEWEMHTSPPAVVASVGPHLLLGTHESLPSVYVRKAFLLRASRQTRSVMTWRRRPGSEREPGSGSSGGIPMEALVVFSQHPTSEIFVGQAGPAGMLLIECRHHGLTARSLRVYSSAAERLFHEGRALPTVGG